MSRQSVPSHYDPHLSMSMACDTSSVGVGVVILHTISNGTEKAVAYDSRKLSLAGTNSMKDSIQCLWCTKALLVFVGLYVLFTD